jgi:hypothetical protein
MIWTVWSVSNHGKQVSSNWLLENVPIHSCALPHILFPLFLHYMGGAYIFGFHQKRRNLAHFFRQNEAELLTVTPVIGLVLTVLKKS